MVVDNTGMCPLGEDKEGGGAPAVTLDPNRFRPQLNPNKKRRCRPIVFLISPKRLLEVGLFCLLAPCHARRGGIRAAAASQMTACQSSPRLHCAAGVPVGLQSICVYPNLNGPPTCKNKQRFPGRQIGSSCSSFVSQNQWRTLSFIYLFLG